ncbi:hypothetical protein [Belnapia sp. F-4-1]|uniref:hypothetical protein n=1 Tax=Belnapia sp. F-4-1 TaxID=1545443 RepID=UPI00068C603B|nr:hypothetical protein [Belnapia sp. F-4-1]
MRRSLLLAPSGAVQPTEWLDARLTLLPSASVPLADGATLCLLTGMAEAFAHLRLPEGEALAPGATALVQLRCDPPLAAMAGDGFILRLPSPAHSIAGGTLVHPED